jgi:hypothetical protein
LSEASGQYVEAADANQITLADRGRDSIYRIVLNLKTKTFERGEQTVIEQSGVNTNSPLQMK